MFFDPVTITELPLLSQFYGVTYALFSSSSLNVGSTKITPWIIRPSNYSNPPGVSICETDLLAHSCKEVTVVILSRYSKVTRGNLILLLSGLTQIVSSRSWLLLMSFDINNFHLFSGVYFPIHSSSSSHPQSPIGLPPSSHFMCSLLLMFVTGHACL